MEQFFLKNSLKFNMMASYILLLILLMAYKTSGKCEPDNCNTCVNNNDWACQTCASGYFVSNSLCCMDKCSTCSSILGVTFCTACVNNSYAVHSPLNQCVLCSNIMTNCLTCNS